MESEIPPQSHYQEQARNAELREIKEILREMNNALTHIAQYLDGIQTALRSEGGAGRW